MENHHFQWENPLFLWPCSIAFCKRSPEGTSINPCKISIPGPSWTSNWYLKFSSLFASKNNLWNRNCLSKQKSKLYQTEITVFFLKHRAIFFCVPTNNCGFVQYRFWIRASQRRLFLVHLQKAAPSKKSSEKKTTKNCSICSFDSTASSFLEGSKFMRSLRWCEATVCRAPRLWVRKTARSRSKKTLESACTALTLNGYVWKWGIFPTK